MAYGHAERVLEAIRRLEDETRDLLGGLGELDEEQAHWLEAARRGDIPPPQAAASPQPAIRSPTGPSISIGK